MKRLTISGCALAFLVGFAALPAPATAQTFEQNVGCGLGSVLMKERDATLFQVLAITTNGILFNQTIGITFGVFGCQQPTLFVENERLNTFVAANMDSLAQDMAAGSGESIATVAELMEVPVEKRADFYAALQSNFKEIYASGGVQSADVIDNISKTSL